MRLVPDLGHEALPPPRLGVLVVVLEQVEALAAVGRQEAELAAVDDELGGGRVLLVVVLGERQELPVLLSLRVFDLRAPSRDIQTERQGQGTEG